MRIAMAAVLLAAPAVAEPSVERGEYLVQGPAGCGNCHTPFGEGGLDMSMDLSGRLVEQNEMFTAIAPNITPGSRVASWSDEELARAIREGIRPDGSLIGPPMPFAVYRGLSDDDLISMVMYLRTVPGQEVEQPASTYYIPLPPAYGPPVTSVSAPAPGPNAEWGAYVAGPVAHCMECHTPFGPKGPMLDTHLGAGGFEFHGPWGVSVASNITPHEHGIAAYSDEELGDMIAKGTRPDGAPMLPPMPYGYLARMTEEDLAAVIAYLRSLEPLPDWEG